MEGRSCLLLLLALVSGIGQAQTVSVNGESSLPGTKAIQPPVIDGVVDASEWGQAPIASGWVEIESQSPAPVDGKIRILYDDAFIYVSGQFDQDPRTVSATEYRRNVSLSGNDSVFIAIDSFGTARSVDTFSINPRGATNIETSTGRAPKTEWLGQFNASGRITETGWEFEARIPWTLLPLPSPGTHDLRINFGRYHSGTKQTYVWKYFKQDLRNFSFWSGVEVPRLVLDRSLKLLPYVYAGIDDDEEHIVNAGVDFKTALTGEVSLVGSINPDFRNIEQDVLSLDFSNFEKLARDARPFFIEGSSFIRTGMDQRLFASQRISSFDFGAKAYGNLSGRTQFGALTTIDFSERQATVASVSHATSDTEQYGFAYVGLQQPGLDNNALQLAYDKRIGDTLYYARGQVTDDDVEHTGSRANSGFVYQAGGLDINAEYVQVTPNFFPRIGFSPEQDLRGFNGSFDYTQSFVKGSTVESTYELSGATYDHFDGSHYRDGISGEGSIAFRSGLGIGYGAVAENFEQFKNHAVFVSVEVPRRDPFRGWGASAVTGRFVDKYYRQLGLSFKYRPIENMQFILSHESVRHFENEEQTVASLRYDLDQFRSVGGRLIRRGDDWNWYLSYRLSGKEGAEYYVILGDPNASQYQHSLIIKVVAPFTIK